MANFLSQKEGSALLSPETELGVIVRYLKHRVLAGLLIVTIFLPRVIELERHWSSDETTWLLRSHGFASALQERDFRQTLQAYHPGVTWQCCRVGCRHTKPNRLRAGTARHTRRRLGVYPLRNAMCTSHF